MRGAKDQDRGSATAEPTDGGGGGGALSAYIALGLAGAGALAILALATVYLFLAFPALDDFCVAAVAPGEEWAWTVAYYQHHSGRWLAILLNVLVQPRIGIEGIGYSLALAGTMAAWFLGFVFGADLIVGRGAPRRLKWLLALLLFALFWAGSPGLSETFYWLNGASVYGIPFLLLAAGLRLLQSADATARGAVYAAGAGAAGVAAAGAHEFAGMLLLGAALCRAVAAWFLGRKREAGNLSLAIVPTGIGIAFVALAPGNAERASHFPLRGDLGRALGQTFVPGGAPLEWLIDPRLLALSALLLTLPLFRALRPQWLALRLPWLILLPVGTLGAVLASHALAAYLIGFPPPPRMLSLLYALFILGWLATLLAIAARFPASPRGGHSTLVPLAAAAAFALTLVASPNSIAAARGLRHSAGPWLAENAAQAQSARSQTAAGQRDLLLPAVTTVPAPLQRQGLTDDATQWLNACLASYLRVDTVRAAPGTGESGRRVWRGER